MFSLGKLKQVEGGATSSNSIGVYRVPTNYMALLKHSYYKFITNYI